MKTCFLFVVTVALGVACRPAQLGGYPVVRAFTFPPNADVALETVKPGLSVVVEAHGKREEVLLAGVLLPDDNAKREAARAMIRDALSPGGASVHPEPSLPRLNGLRRVYLQYTAFIDRSGIVGEYDLGEMLVARGLASVDVARDFARKADYLEAAKKRWPKTRAPPAPP